MDIKHYHIEPERPVTRGKPPPDPDEPVFPIITKKHYLVLAFLAGWNDKFGVNSTEIGLRVFGADYSRAGDARQPLLSLRSKGYVQRVLNLQNAGIVQGTKSTTTTKCAKWIITQKGRLYLRNYAMPER
jgi:hypothetical protein